MKLRDIEIKKNFKCNKCNEKSDEFHIIPSYDGTKTEVFCDRCIRKSRQVT